MRFLRQSLSGLFLLSVTLGLLVYAGTLVREAVEARLSQEPRVPRVRERIFAVNVVRVDPQTLTPVLTAFGAVQSRRELEVRAATAGQIVELAEGFEEGGHVEEGQFLVQIDPGDAQLALDRVNSDILDAEAETREADAALVLARDELSAAREQAALRETAYARQKDLLDRGVGTAASVETAELAASSARQAVLTRRQAVAQAESRVSQAATARERAGIAQAEAQRRLADTRITARFSGTLSEVNAIEGRLVSNNEQLARLVDPDALEVSFRVSTSQYARLIGDGGRLTNAPVRATLDVLGTGLVGEGTLVRDSAAVGEGQTGRLLFARLDVAKGMKPGDFVTVEIEEPPLEQVVRLPSSALDAAGGVLVLGDEDRLEEMAVTLLRRQGDDVLVRADGLGGRDVVAERTPLLGAGIKVRALRPGTGQTTDQNTDRNTDQTTGAEPASQASARPEEPELLELTEERKARIRAFVETNDRMPKEAKERLLAQLDQPRMPANVVRRIEARMGG
ncbi:HlyD family efflux transporter periplasmic adaptor subunit [Marinovum sp. 2_MG-2023]|uniref:efflux RND transporter periplasmic adaptor subunit n=1 Tax=unclassified Marinovum TaxID=2647166 RepID=UPI0026E2E020|nr:MULTISPECIES: HlyD family efflux transporter periplasmic adaptor subunit [unclassified Marinovum]MDO6728404.1 HlyD family efflux transporter periplasmic adaptor subunit [Marinovum sp. 2_MG-2023]MDO6778180.1 HlyD family efflux transporter periplasmic adaptor subunit [Marinovum sp. 1_MG-2023]